MKTAQRILSTALILLNEHGEASVSSVDIADECDISPGNLYYHFKGKEELIDALMDLHKSEMNELLNEQRVKKLSIDDMFFYLFSIIQGLHLFRFMYRSPADLVEKYPSHQKQHRQFMARLENTLTALFQSCKEQKTLYCGDCSITDITELTAVVITQSCQYDHLMRSKKHTSLVHNTSDKDSEFEQYHALSLLVTALGPRCKLSEETLVELQKAVTYHNLSTTSDNG